MIAHACNLSIQEVDPKCKEFKVSLAYNEFQASWGYVRSCLKKKEGEEEERLEPLRLQYSILSILASL